MNLETLQQPDKKPRDDRPEVEQIYSLTTSRNAEVVKAAIKAKYGIAVHDRFAQDLIDFVEALTDGQ